MISGKAYRISKREYLCIAQTDFKPQIYIGIKPSNDYILYKYDIMLALTVTHRKDRALHCYPSEFIECVKELE